MCINGKVIATSYDNNAESINQGLSDLIIALEEQDLNVDLSAAAEYYVDFDFHERIRNKDFLVFGNNNILIEFFCFSWL